MVDPCGQFWGCPRGHPSHLPPLSGDKTSCVSLSRFLPEPRSSLFDVSLLTQSLPFLLEGQGSSSQTNVASEAGLKVFSQRPQAHFFFLCLRSAKAAIRISNAPSRGAAEPFITRNEFVRWGFFGLKDGLMTSIALARAQRPESLSVCLLFWTEKLTGSVSIWGQRIPPQALLLWQSALICEESHRL